MPITTIKSPDNLSLIDLATQRYGSVEGLFLLLENNPVFDLNADVSVGENVVIQQGVAILTVFNEPKTTIKPKEENVICLGQNTLDLSLQYYGSLEGLFGLLDDLGKDSVNAVVSVGEMLNVSPAKIPNQKMVSYLKKRNIFINTGTETGDRQFDDSFDDSFA
jgi:hypothetical protein